jgi:hypothetical protein
MHTRVHLLLAMVPILSLPGACLFAADRAIITQEFLYDRATFSSCHASTICETSAGLIASFFGGSKEGAPDVAIWVCRQIGGHWTEPAEVARGVADDGKPTPAGTPFYSSRPAGRYCSSTKSAQSLIIGGA